MNLLLQTIPSTIISEIFANSEFDGVVLDTEHGIFDDISLFNCIQIITLLNKKCFVRVTHLDKKLVRMCLDSGVDGLIFSTIENEKQGNEIISYCRYPNKGGKRGQGLVRENKWGKLSLGNTNPIIMAQIETKEGVDNLSKIINCKFDKFILGPYDLSASLGCTEQWDNPLYRSYIKKIWEQYIPKKDLGVFLPKENNLTNFKDRDKFGILIIGMDVIMISDYVKKLYNSNEENKRSYYRNR